MADHPTERAASDVLIVVDVQRGFVNPNSEHVVPVIAELAKDWRDQGGTVIATRYFNTPGSQWERFLGWAKLMGPPETDLMPEIAPHVDLTVDKRSYTSLVPAMLGHIPDPPTAVYVCGIDTDICVLKTAVDLFERGNQATVLAHACASHAGQQAHEAGLRILERFIGQDQVVDRAPARS